MPEYEKNLSLIEQWVEENDKHPVIVKERFIDTSREAEKHFIVKEDSEL